MPDPLGLPHHSYHVLVTYPWIGLDMGPERDEDVVHAVEGMDRDGPLAPGDWNQRLLQPLSDLSARSSLG